MTMGLKLGCVIYECWGEAEKMKYTDIGHDFVSAFVWIFKDGRLWATPASVGTHEALYGIEALNHWRGVTNRKPSAVP